MRTRSWTNYGFWLMLGVASGMLISDLTNEPALHAATTSQRDEYLIATGQSNSNDVDVVWVLDYLGARLVCISMTRQATFGGMTEIDLLEQFPKLAEDKKAKPKFMMVTGQFVTQEIADLCYVAETSTGEMIAVAVPSRFDAQLRPLSPPRVTAKFSFLNPR